MAHSCDPRALAEGEGGALALRSNPELGLTVIERFRGLVSGDEVPEVVDDVVKLFVPPEELAVASPEGVDQARDRIETVALGIVKQHDAAAVPGFAFATLENPKERPHDVIGSVDLQVACVDGPKHARVAPSG